MNEQGRWRMVKELREIQNLFERTIQSFEQAVQPAWDHLGFNKERLQGVTDEYIRRHREKGTS